MLDHFSVSVKDYSKSIHFYDETLSLLGGERLMTFESPDEKVAGYGINKKPSFWIGWTQTPKSEEEIGKAQGVHLAFQAPSVEAIQAWHAKCLELGGVDNGQPGPRKEYHPGYYSGFIVDPNGWRIEAVLHTYVPSSS